MERLSVSGTHAMCHLRSSKFSIFLLILISFIFEGTDLISELEPMLKKFENDDGLKINNVEEEAGCKIGDNYMSVVMRNFVQGSHGDGRNYRKSLMTKYLPSHREITKVFGTGALFHNESYFYTRLLPLLGEFGPNCVHADEEKIIMEDLKAAGYVVLERTDLLDLEHSIETVKTLARLHASSLALKLDDPSGFLELTKPLKEVLFPRTNVPSLGISIENSLTIATKHLESIEETSEELAAGIRFIKGFEGKLYPMMQELVDPGRGKYDVITHGDCWNNNVMFSHDSGGKVLDVKLLDFQISRHVSAAIDFHYFVYSSPKCSVIEENYEDLVKAYHSTFLDTLRDKKAPRDSIDQLGIDWFENELRKFSKYGLFIGFWITGAILAEDDDLIDMDNFTMQQLEEKMSKEVKIVPRIAQRVKCILTHYVRRYI